MRAIRRKCMRISLWPWGKESLQQNPKHSNFRGKTDGFDYITTVEQRACEIKLTEKRKTSTPRSALSNKSCHEDGNVLHLC